MNIWEPVIQAGLVKQGLIHKGEFGEQLKMLSFDKREFTAEDAKEFVKQNGYTGDLVDKGSEFTVELHGGPDACDKELASITMGIGVIGVLCGSPDLEKQVKENPYIPKEYVNKFNKILIQNNKTLIRNNKVRKRRVSIKDPSEAPEGARVQTGPRGGLFFETEGVKPQEEAEEAEEVITARDIESAKESIFVELEGLEFEDLVDGLMEAWYPGGEVSDEEFNDIQEQDPDAFDSKEDYLEAIRSAQLDEKFSDNINAFMDTLSEDKIKDEAKRLKVEDEDETPVKAEPTKTTFADVISPKDLSDEDVKSVVEDLEGDWNRYAETEPDADNLLNTLRSLILDADERGLQEEMTSLQGVRESVAEKWPKVAERFEARTEAEEPSQESISEGADKLGGFIESVEEKGETITDQELRDGAEDFMDRIGIEEDEDLRESILDETMGRRSEAAQEAERQINEGLDLSTSVLGISESDLDEDGNIKIGAVDSDKIQNMPTDEFGDYITRYGVELDESVDEFGEDKVKGDMNALVNYIVDIGKDKGTDDNDFESFAVLAQDLVGEFIDNTDVEIDENLQAELDGPRFPQYIGRGKRRPAQEQYGDK